MTYVLFASLTWKLIDLVRSVANYRTQRSAIVTQLAAWVGGIVMVTIGAHAAVADTLTVPGTTMTLGHLDLASQVLVGMLVASLAGTGVDFKQAFDRSDSAAKPPMFGEDPQATNAPVTARGAADAQEPTPAPHVTVNVPTPSTPAGNVIQVPLTPEPAPAVTAEPAALVAARQEAAEAAGAAHAAAESAAAALERAEAAATRAAHLEAPPTPQEHEA